MQFSQQDLVYEDTHTVLWTCWSFGFLGWKWSSNKKSQLSHLWQTFRKRHCNAVSRVSQVRCSEISLQFCPKYQVLDWRLLIFQRLGGSVSKHYIWQAFRCYVSDRLMNRGFGLCFVPRGIFVITFSVRNLTTERRIGTGRVVYRVKTRYGIA